MNRTWNFQFTIGPSWIIAIGVLLGWVAVLASWFADKFFDRLEGLLR